MTVGRALRILAALFVVVAIAGAAFVGWNRYARRAGPENPGFSCPAVVPGRHRVPFTARGVRRVALIGDSLMSNASCTIARSLAGVGITTSLHGVPGSGLLAGMDWVAA